jgi:glycosyltransferase involved in cell wall biosynthesis
MRILFVISGLGRGGAEEQVLLFAKELTRLGHDASIYVLSRHAERACELAGSAVQVVLDDKRHWFSPGVVRRLRRHIARLRPDIVHSFHCDADVYSRLAAAGSGVPVINSERTDHQRVAPLQRIGYRVSSGLCHGVVANTHAGGQFAQRLHRLPAERVDVLWNVIDLPAVDERLARSAKPAHQLFAGAHLKRVCMVGSIHPQNDYLLALRALRRLVDRDASWRLLCAGEEPAAARGYKAQVLAERERLELGPYVQFVGHRRDVVELIGSSELMLVTASRGGFPVVAVEAMACGVPVVGTDYGELRRLLPDARQIAASRHAADVAGAVLRCFEAAESIRHAQRRWVERHGTVQSGAAALLAIYAKYLGHAVSRTGPAPLRRGLPAPPG